MAEWTPEHKDELRLRWSRGESAGKIAEAMNCGFSRNAVIGQVHRLGLPARRTTDAIPAPSRGGSQRPRRAVARATPRKSIRGTRQGPLRRERPPVPPDAIPFLDTRDATTFRAGRCKFPVDGQDVVSKFLFCGHATSVGTVYCATHNAVAYDQVPVRQHQFAMRR